MRCNSSFNLFLMSSAKKYFISKQLSNCFFCAFPFVRHHKSCGSFAGTALFLRSAQLAPPSSEFVAPRCTLSGAMCFVAIVPCSVCRFDDPCCHLWSNNVSRRWSPTCLTVQIRTFDARVDALRLFSSAREQGSEGLPAA